MNPDQNNPSVQPPAESADNTAATVDTTATVAPATASSSAVTNTKKGKVGQYHDHRYVPLAPIARVMDQCVPADARISREACRAVQECLSEYISYVMTEARSICQSKSRMILNGEDILWALEHLGFEDYVGPLTLYLQRYRLSEGDNKIVEAGPQHKPPTTTTDPVSGLKTFGLSVGVLDRGAGSGSSSSAMAEHELVGDALASGMDGHEVGPSAAGTDVGEGSSSSKDPTPFYTFI